MIILLVSSGWQSLRCFVPKGGTCIAIQKSGSCPIAHFKSVILSGAPAATKSGDLAAKAQDAKALDNGLRIVEERHFGDDHAHSTCEVKKRQFFTRG